MSNTKSAFKKIGSLISAPFKKIGNVIGFGDSNGSFVYNLLKPFKPSDGSALNPLNLFSKNKYTYCGPFNDIPDDINDETGRWKSKNKIDRICKGHDFKYNEAFQQHDKALASKLERDADIWMLNELKNVKPQGVDEYLGYLLAKGGIGAKVYLENLFR